MLELLQQAVRCHQQGRLDEAERLYRQVLLARPGNFDALNCLGLLKFQTGDLASAVDLLSKASAADPASIDTLNSLGAAFFRLKREAEGIAAFNRALSLDARNVQTLYNFGRALQDLKRHEEALAYYERAIAAQPGFLPAVYNRGLVLRELKRYEASLKCFDQVLAVQPQNVDALNNRGLVLHSLRRFGDAMAAFSRAIQLSPTNANALLNRGNTLQELGQFEQAISDYDTVLAMQPKHADAALHRGNACYMLKRFDEALGCFDLALQIKPDLDFLPGNRLITKLFICNWSNLDSDFSGLVEAIRQGKAAAQPFCSLIVPSTADDQLTCAKAFAATLSTSSPALWQGERYRHERIRIAYLSANFNRHAVANLVAELFELHDRSQFEVIGVSFGADDRSEIRARIAQAFEQFVDVAGESDESIARLIRNREIDIVVDLMGYTQESRPNIVALRPAPIQVNYLGYPCTTGANFVDYVLADEVTLPFDQQPFYVERIVHFYDCYQVNDRKRLIASQSQSRAEAGLPASAFVYCCFNNSYKITPTVFSIWMRLLEAVEGSVLWLLRDNPWMERNLRLEAQKRGVDPERLVFAGRMPLAEHLARHRLADLFLDTLPYNAHTTASDALWAGLPVLTCRGETFAGRVAASLLNAAGLPQLITENLADYEALALKLARDRGLLNEIKTKLGLVRDSCSLFDTERFTRHLEKAYRTMWEIHQRGESPRSFSVEKPD
jgi:protein O-GlcNAc transferase